MSAETQHRLFPGFAGVALADILANSVAIILLMIVITIMIKQEQEEKRIEQVEDMSILLSRDIATSVVMNALPTSPPARLHDYENSALDRNPTHTIMPIIELHRDYIRNYYNGKTFSRDELLLQDNTFDKYLKSLNRTQRNYMRMDIYDIQLFYITMSILKSYDARPKHWHFIGYSGTGDARGDGAKGSGGGSEDQISSEAREEDEAGGEKEQNDNTASQSEKETRQSEGNSYPGIPQDAKLDLNAGGLANYPYDDLAYESGSSQQQQLPPEDLPGSSGAPADKWTETRDNLFGALAQMMSKSTSQPQAHTSRFRSARASKNNRPQRDNQPEKPHQQKQVKAQSLRLLLPALFKFMRLIQEEADAGSATRLAQYDFRRDILPLLKKQKIGNSPPHLKSLFDRLDGLLRVIPENTDVPPTVTQETNLTLRANALSVPLNDRIATVALVGNELQNTRSDLPAEITASLHFGLYPTIYQGVRAPLRQGTLLLMHPQQETPNKFRWRVVTLVSPAVDDFMTAFIYSALDDKGRLLIAAEENALSIDNARITTHYPIDLFRNEQWLLLIYGIPALLLALGILRRNRKAA